MKDGIKIIKGYKRNSFLILYFILILNLFSCISISDEKFIYLNKLTIFSSEIHMVIKGNGNQSILNDSFSMEPSEVFVNGIFRESCKKFCELEYEENNVTLYFNNSVTSCEFMFSELNNIKEIDFSYFDFSSVTTMSLCLEIV